MSAQSGPPAVVFGRLPRWVVRFVVLPFALVVALHACAIDTFRVHGSSMETALAPGDLLLVSKLGPSRAWLVPWLPARGEIVVFRLPQNSALLLVKRVVALPGDRVDPAQLGGGTDHVVPAGHLFVVGDNRAPGASDDSRDWGDLPARAVVGSAVLRLWPLGRAGAP
jgi:signal peptidase I